MQNKKGQLFRCYQKEEMIALEGGGQMVEGLGATIGMESKRDGSNDWADL